MRSQRSILALRYTPVSVVGGVRKAVGGFLRYVQYRDQHLEPDTTRAVDAYVRYVAHRDRTSARGRVFGRDGDLTDADRRRFVDFIARSTKGLAPKWALGKDGKRVDRQRAVYTFVLSPEDWHGLELRQLTRVAMKQLESETGPAGIGPWFAAEHRNTAHRHVHIVLAARREVEPRRFSTLLVTRVRLQRMKDAIAHEVERQRTLDHGRTEQTRRPLVASQSLTLDRHLDRTKTRWRWAPRQKARRIAHARPRQGLDRPIATTLLRLRAVARSYRRLMEHELEREYERVAREEWAA